VAQISSVDKGPDIEQIHHLEDFTDDFDSPATIESEWLDILSSELSSDDESLLCVDLNNMSCDESTQLDPSIIAFLRQQREATTGPDKYMKEFSPVFAKATFDHLPPRCSWDHAIELKADIKPLTSKVYPLSKSEQVVLDEFLKEHLKSTRIHPSKSPIAAPFFFVKKKDRLL
jgi:hypothetical protein